MKTTIPKKITSRDKVVDTMAKKFANTDTVEARIIASRKRRREKPIYLYILIGVGVVTTLFSTLISTGVISPDPIMNRIAPAPVRNNIVDLLSKGVHMAAQHITARGHVPPEAVFQVFAGDHIGGGFHEQF